MKVLKNRVKQKLGEDRYNHTINVLETSLQLAKQYSVEEEKVEIAALLHDYAKELSIDEISALVLKYKIYLDDNSTVDINLMHGELASLIAEDDFGIEDRDILNAIKYHTTGRKNMSLLEKIIYLADVIEPSRNCDKLKKIRQMAYINLDKAVLMSLNNTLEFLINSGSLIHMDTIKARNYILTEINKRLLDE